MKHEMNHSQTNRQAMDDTVSIITAWIAHNRISATELPDLVREVHKAVAEVSGLHAAEAEMPQIQIKPEQPAPAQSATPAPKATEKPTVSGSDRRKPAAPAKSAPAPQQHPQLAATAPGVLDKKLEKKLAKLRLPEDFRRAETQADVDRIIAETVFPDGIVCVFDGVKKRMLKRHVRAKWGLEWEEYLKVVGLPEDYPSACTNLLLQKREAALDSIGGEKMRLARERVARRRRREQERLAREAAERKVA